MKPEALYFPWSGPAKPLLGSPSCTMKLHPLPGNRVLPSSLLQLLRMNYPCSWPSFENIMESDTYLPSSLAIWDLVLQGYYVKGIKHTNQENQSNAIFYLMLCTFTYKVTLHFVLIGFLKKMYSYFSLVSGEYA